MRIEDGEGGDSAEDVEVVGDNEPVRAPET